MGIWRSFTARAFESFLKKCARRPPSQSMETGFQGIVPELCWVNLLTASDTPRDRLGPSASPLQLRWWRAPPAGPPRPGLCPQGRQARGLGETGHASSPYNRSARRGHRNHPSDLVALVWTSRCRNICIHVVISNDSSKYCSILFMHSPASGQTCNN